MVPWAEIAMAGFVAAGCWTSLYFVLKTVMPKSVSGDSHKLSDAVLFIQLMAVFGFSFRAAGNCTTATARAL
jgi:hypothetical protein